jgi:DNA-binding beta-propeller fold protein YncE
MVAATFLDPATGDVVDQVDVGETLPGFPFGSSVAVSPDRRLVAVTWAVGTTVLDTRTRDVIARIVLPSTTVWCAGWTPDGSRLLLGTESREAPETGGPLVVVDTDTWRVDEELPIGGAAQTIETSPDGRVLAVAHELTHSIAILDAEALEVLRTIQVPEAGRVFDLSFSPDGRLLAAAGEFGRLAVLDTRTWRPTGAPTPVHDQAVLQVEWLPDGRTAVATSGDGTVSLVDVERGLLRGRQLPGSREPGPGLAHLVPGLSDEIVVLSGERTGMR